MLAIAVQSFYHRLCNCIPSKIIPVDAAKHPDSKNQFIHTLGKDKTVVALSFIMDSEDFTEMNKALDTVHWLF